VVSQREPGDPASPHDANGWHDTPALGARNSPLLIHDSVREAILNGELPAGSPVSQAKIAKRFGVSRGPVREALRLLEREGLVEAEINQRPRVAGLSPEDLEELYALRLTEESLAIRVSVPRFTAADLNQLNTLRAGMEMTAEGRDTAAYDLFHHDFHRELVKHAGARLVARIDQLYDHAERYRRLYRASTPRAWPVAAQEHRDIAAACEGREAVRASHLLARHLSRTALTVLALMKPEYEPVLVRTALQLVLGLNDAAAPSV
jgi:DNA-binding GntR family transcriptional regulator